MQAVQEKVETVAGAVTDLLQGNPFQTAVGQRIEQATDSALTGPDWSLNMEICDLINESENGPKDAIRAIRKRLQQNMGKNHIVIMYTLTVLESCVKNCNARFHAAVAQKEFILELVKLIGPKFDPPQIVQEKVLNLIQSWAEAFHGKPELHGIVDVYDELKAKGVDFPTTDVDDVVPIHTPAKNCQGAATSTVVAASIHLTPNQMGKLRSELDVVQGNLTVLREMLSEMHPGVEAEGELQLLQELFASCQSMQQRIVELLGIVADETVTSELLLMNDELNNVFDKYSRYQLNRKQNLQPVSKDSNSEAAQPLIDFGSEPSNSLSSRLAAATVGNDAHIGAVPTICATSAAEIASNSLSEEHKKRDFELRSVVDKTKANIPSADAGTVHTPDDNEQDLQEVQKWLNSQEGQKQERNTAEGTSKEFDEFLIQRAAAVITRPETQTSDSPATLRQIKPKEAQDEQKLFAL